MIASAWHENETLYWNRKLWNIIISESVEFGNVHIVRTQKGWAIKDGKKRIGYIRACDCNKDTDLYAIATQILSDYEKSVKNQPMETRIINGEEHIKIGEVAKIINLHYDVARKLFKWDSGRIRYIRDKSGHRWFNLNDVIKYEEMSRPDEFDRNEWITSAKAAKMLSYQTQTIQWWAREGKIDYRMFRYKRGLGPKRMYVRKSQVEAILQEKRRK